MLATQPDTTTDQSVLTFARHAVELLDHATAHDLPAPWYASVGDSDLTLAFHTLADLTAWAFYVDEPIQTTTSSSGNVHHAVTGAALGKAVRFYYIEQPAEATR